MADLEDKILKKNIPGKYTWWEKDSDEEGEKARADWVDRDASDPETEMTELQKQKAWVENDCPEPIRRTIMARQERERARTGVKGVLADFDAWKLSADAENQLAKEYRAAMLKRLTEGHTIEVPAPDTAPAGKRDETGDSSDDDSDDGADFLGSYREKRLQQLKSTAGRPHFGQIREAERSNFVAAVDTEDPRTFVVVHLYEPYIASCRRMNRFLEILAAQHPTVKFLRLPSTAADGGDFDPVALPTLLLYRAGEVVGCLTRVTDDLGENFAQEDVEWLLQEHDVFEVQQSKPSAVNAGSQHHAMATKGRTIGPAALSDDEDSG